MNEELELIFEEIKTLLAERKYAQLYSHVKTLQPADIALLFEEISMEDVILTFRLLPKDTAADTFVELEPDRQMQLIALRDTGNTLRDPLTGEQVLVAGADVGEKLLGLTAQQLRNPVETVAQSTLRGLRLIPYRGVGQPGGMLLAVRPVLPGLYIQNNIVYYPVSLPVFFVLLCLLYGASVLLSFLLGETPPARLFCTLRLVQGGTEVSFRAKIDTGCALREPFSGRPAVLVSAAALETALPASVQAYLAGEKPAPGMRLVPYDTVNGSGLLPAFFPEELLDENGRPLHGCVAVTGRALGGTGFSAVVNPALLRDDA